MDRLPELPRLEGERSVLVGSLVAIAAIATTTVLIFGLRQVVPVISTGVVYLVAVMLVSTYWGLGLGLATAVGSALAFNFFHIAPTGGLTIADPENWIALVIFLVAAAITSTIAELARSQAADAEARREEADIATEMARVLLGSASLPDALSLASRRLGEALALPGIAIVVDAAPPAGRPSVDLDLGPGHSGLLALPRSTSPELEARVRERIAPSLQTLLRAALDRDSLQREAVETVALRRSDMVKTALLRAVSHDLRSPLTAIIAAAATLDSEQLPAAERAELVDVVSGEAARLSHLVDQLLDLSRLEAGAAEPRRDWCSLEEVVRSAVEQLDSTVGIELDLDPELPLVRADAAQLERVFVNLLENARRHAGGGPIRVAGLRKGESLAIRVIDHGPGISAADRDRIFEPFYRRPSTAGGRGSGLGLAIARGFVEANGGHIRAESLPGQGSVFVVELPTGPSASDPAPPARRVQA